MTLTHNPMVIWFLRQTRLLQYFIIALLFHLAALLFLGTVKVAAFLPQYIAAFEMPGAGESPGNSDTSATTPDNLQYDPPQLTQPTEQPATQPTAQMARFLTQVSNSEQAPAAAVVSAIGVHSDSAMANFRPPGLDSVVAPPPPGTLVNTGSSGIGGPVSGAGRFPGGAPATPGSLTANRTKEGRAKAAQQHGGADPRIENAVLSALRYFKKTQKPDGSWTADGHTIGISAMVTLTFLGHGETPESDEFGDTVDRALRFLVSSVDSEGRLVIDGKSRAAHEGYQIPLVTLAMSEAYVMTKAPVLQPPLNRLVQQIIAAQNVKKEGKHDGGWRYNVTSADSDLSVSGWMIMALKSARDAGVNIPPQAFTKAEKYVTECFKDNREIKGHPSGFGYEAGHGATPSMTAVGVLCLQFLGASRDSRVKDALEFLTKSAVMDWKEGKPEGFPLYTWYYTTQALFHAQNQHKSEWSDWNRKMITTLVGAQKTDGSWAYPLCSSSELGHTHAKTNEDSTFYSTALCTLMLEVYYRYLPIYQHLTPPISQMPPAGHTVAMDIQE